MTHNTDVGGDRTCLKVGLYDVYKTIGYGNHAMVKLAKHRFTKTEVRPVVKVSNIIHYI